MIYVFGAFLVLTGVKIPLEKDKEIHYGLSAILIFVGAKMLLADFYKIPVAVALSRVAGVLIISLIASMAFPRKETYAGGGL